MHKTEILENGPQVKLVDFGQLSNYQKRTIITIASKRLGIDRIAKLLKPLKFCTPQTALKVIEERKLLADEDFIQLKEKLLEPTEKELKQADETVQAEPEQVKPAKELTTSEQAEKAEQISEKTAKAKPERKRDKPKRKRDKPMSEDETVMMIKMHLNGAANDKIAEKFGRTKKQIIKRLAYAKTANKYKSYFDSGKAETSEKSEPPKSKSETYIAKGEGYIFVDAIGDNITLNGDSVLRKIAEYLDNRGLNDFYGKVEVRITVMNKPVGIQISEEE